MIRILINLLMTLAIYGCSLPNQIFYHHDAPEEFAKFYATGYAPIKTQMGKNKTEKLLRAICNSTMIVLKIDCMNFHLELESAV